MEKVTRYRCRSRLPHLFLFLSLVSLPGRIYSEQAAQKDDQPQDYPLSQSILSCCQPQLHLHRQQPHQPGVAFPDAVSFFRFDDKLPSPEPLPITPLHVQELTLSDILAMSVIN